MFLRCDLPISLEPHFGQRSNARSPASRAVLRHADQRRPNGFPSIRTFFTWFRLWCISDLEECAPSSGNAVFDFGLRLRQQAKFASSKSKRKSLVAGSNASGPPKTPVSGPDPRNTAGFTWGLIKGDHAWPSQLGGRDFSTSIFRNSWLFLLPANRAHRAIRSTPCAKHTEALTSKSRRHFA